MWSLAIAKMRAPLWLKENNWKLMTMAMVCVALLCANLLLYGALIAPSDARLKTMEAKSADLRRRHAEAVLFREQRRLFAGIMAGVPAQKDMPILVKDLVQTARRLNLSVASVKYDIPSRAGGELAMLTFSFPAEGRYPDIKRFIYNVETSDRLVGIQDLKMTSEKSRVSLEMKLFTYIKGL
jgi:Tfp pilus assembly protein PilO